MTPEMAFESLLICGDPDVACAMEEVLSKLSIEVERSKSAANACDIIADRRHELVVIDWEGDASYRLLHAIWNVPKRRPPTVVAISSDDRHIVGAHFTVRKPLESRPITESMKAVYSHMVLEYRVSARFAVMSHVMAKDNSGRSIPVIVTDIGEGGMGITTKETLTVGDALCLTVPLPQLHVPVNIRARILWTRDYGTAGGYFLGMPRADRDVLRGWLKTKTQVKKPRMSVGEDNE